MKTTVRDIYNYIDKFAPFSTQAEWDNAGLLVGDEDKVIDTIVVALDITTNVIETAKKYGAELIVSHHPVIFHAKKSFLKGEPPYMLAENGISAICAHTNYDAAIHGVSCILAKKIGLNAIRPIYCNGEKSPVLRVGSLENPLTANELARVVKKKLSASCIRYANGGRQIFTVAVCGGAGTSYLEDAARLGYDALVTGEAAHHEFLRAKEIGITLIAAGHFYTENIAVQPLARRIKLKFPELKVVSASELSFKHTSSEK